MIYNYHSKTMILTHEPSCLNFSIQI